MRKTRPRIWTKILALVLITALFILGILIGQGVFFEESQPEISSETIGNIVSEISQYAVLEYRYTNVGKFEDRVEFYGWKVPFTSKSFIVTYDGSMKLGIDSPADIRVEGKKITVILSPARVLSHEIYEDSIEVMDQSKNVFNQIEVEDYTAFATDSKAEMEEKARSSGMFDDASNIAAERAKKLIESLPGIDAEYSVDVITNS